MEIPKKGTIQHVGDKHCFLFCFYFVALDGFKAKGKNIWNSRNKIPFLFLKDNYLLLSKTEEKHPF